MKVLATAAGTLILLAAAAPAEQPPNPRVKGERVFLKCFSCHTLDPAAARLPGPDLLAIIGRRTAARPGFAYSQAMRRFAARNGRWTVPLLDRYIADPEQIVPGTSMAFPGIRNPNERRELLDYLRSRGRKPT